MSYGKINSIGLFIDGHYFALIDEGLGATQRVNVKGLIVANADDKVTDKEIEHIIQNLAGLQIFPKRFLDAIARADVGKLFTQSVQNILKQNPGMRDGILEYMMSLVLSDKEIAKEEIGLIYGFGNDIGFTEKEISVKFAGMIQRNYVPSLEAIC